MYRNPFSKTLNLSQGVHVPRVVLKTRSDTLRINVRRTGGPSGTLMCRRVDPIPDSDKLQYARVGDGESRHKSALFLRDE